MQQCLNVMINFHMVLKEILHMEEIELEIVKLEVRLSSYMYFVLYQDIARRNIMMLLTCIFYCRENFNIVSYFLFRKRLLSEDKGFLTLQPAT